MSYVDSTCRDDVTPSELVNGGTIHDIISIQTMTLLGEEAGVGRNVWDSRREWDQNKPYIYCPLCNTPIVASFPGLLHHQISLVCRVGEHQHRLVH